VVRHRLAELVDYARSLRTSGDPGDALLAFVDRLVLEAAPKRDLVDALAAAEVEVGPAITASAAELRDELGHLLLRAQRAGAIREDIGPADLMALISGVLLALQSGSAKHVDPQLLLAVIRDGLRVHSASASLHSARTK
jgi:hypothetical protein